MQGHRQEAALGISIARAEAVVGSEYISPKWSPFPRVNGFEEIEGYDTIGLTFFRSLCCSAEGGLTGALALSDNNGFFQNWENTIVKLELSRSSHWPMDGQG